MKLQKGSEPTNKNKSPESEEWFAEDCRAFTDLFALLLEMYIDQQNNRASKENYADKPKVKPP